jgi:hypothetical protein
MPDAMNHYRCLMRRIAVDQKEKCEGSDIFIAVLTKYARYHNLIYCTEFPTISHNLQPFIRYQQFSTESDNITKPQVH